MRTDFANLQKLTRSKLPQSAFSPLYARVLRRWYEVNLPAHLRVCQGYIVDQENCSPLQDLIIYDSKCQPLCEEENWKMIPSGGIRALLKVRAGNLSEADLKRELREYVVPVNVIASRTQPPVLLGFWAPQAKPVGMEKVSSMVQAISGPAQRSFSLHLALGNESYTQKGNQSPENFLRQSHGYQGDEPETALFLTAASLAWGLLPADLTPSAISSQRLTERLKLPVETTPRGISDPNESKRYRLGRSHEKIGHVAPPRNLVHEDRVMDPREESGITNGKVVPPVFQDERGNTALHRLVLTNKVAGVKKHLAESLAPLNVKNREGNTPLHLACLLGHGEVVALLLAVNPDVDAKNYGSATPLHLAVEAGQKEIVQLLIEAGAEIDVRNQHCQTPLHIAAINGKVACSQQLLQAGADFRARMEKGIEPLHLAAWFGEGKLVQALIRRGAAINVRNEDGNTPLHFAAFNGKVKAIKMLINHQADPRLKNQTGLTYLDGFREGYQGESNRLFG